MQLRVLGTMSPYATLNHNCPGFLVTEGKNKIMLDCGSGCHSMLDLPDGLENLFVMISHLHRDHYNDIHNIQYASYVFHKQGRLEYPVSIYLPQSPVSNCRDVVAERVAYIEYNIMNENSFLRLNNMQVSFCKVDHAIETYAIKVTNGKQILVYTSDLSFSSKEKIVEFARGADVLICESSLLKSYGFPEINSHLTAEQAGIIAKEADVKLLVLTHFWPEEPVEHFVAEAKNVFSRVIAARENEVIDLDEFE